MAVKGQLTDVEKSVDAKKEGSKKAIPDYTRGSHAYEVKGMSNQTVEWTNNALNAIKTAKECKTPAVVFEVPLQGKGMKKEIFRNEHAAYPI